jgi:hypothetical protein
VRTVTAPDGSVHTVRIEWIGNRLRRAPAELRRRVVRNSRLGRGRDPDGDARDRRESRGSRVADALGDGCMDIEALAFVALALVVVALLFVVVLPTLYGLVELLVVILAGALVWLFRVLFGRPWSIVHRGPGDVVSEQCAVVGWRRAHSTLVAAADEIGRTGSARHTFGAAVPFS